VAYGKFMRSNRKKHKQNLLLGEEKVFKKSKKAMNQGLKILGQLWARGLKPWDLRLHFFLTWLARENGNVFRLAKTIGMHRNSVIVIFKKERGTAKSLKLRMIQIKTCDSPPSWSF